MSALSILGKALGETVMLRLRETGRCHIPGFGVFTLKVRPSRRIRNPSTKALMTIPESLEVRFHAAKRLKGMARKSSGRPLAASPVRNCDTEATNVG